MKKFILFDFDGVIADSFMVASTLAKRFCIKLDENEYRQQFEGNINDMHDALEKADHGPGCDHTMNWNREYTERFRESVRPFEEMVGIIKGLSKDNTLIIVSSGQDPLIRQFLEAEGIGQDFAEILGLYVHRKKTEKIRMIFQKYGVKPDDCVFVTDTLGDIREGREAGIGSIGVSWGFHNNETLEKGEPFRIIHSPQELPAAIADYFAQVRA